MLDYSNEYNIYPFFFCSVLMYSILSALFPILSSRPSTHLVAQHPLRYTPLSLPLLIFSPFIDFTLLFITVLQPLSSVYSGSWSVPSYERSVRAYTNILSIRGPISTGQCEREKERESLCERDGDRKRVYVCVIYEREGREKWSKWVCKRDRLIFRASGRGIPNFFTFLFFPFLLIFPSCFAYYFFLQICLNNCSQNAWWQLTW